MSQLFCPAAAFQSSRSGAIKTGPLRPVLLVRLLRVSQTALLGLTSCPPHDIKSDWF